MLKRGDQVMIKRGVWKGCMGEVMELINGGERYSICPLRNNAEGNAGQYPVSYAASSVEPVDARTAAMLRMKAGEL